MLMLPADQTAVPRRRVDDPGEVGRAHRRRQGHSLLLISFQVSRLVKNSSELPKRSKKKARQ